MWEITPLISGSAQAAIYTRLLKGGYMVRMKKNGAYMDCYNAREVFAAQAKGWSIVEPPKPPPKKKSARAKK